MPHFTHTPERSTPPPFPDTQSIGDDVSRLRIFRSSSSDESDSTSLSSTESQRPRSKSNGSPKGKAMSAKQRRAFFSKADKRRVVTFGPGVRIANLSKISPFLFLCPYPRMWLQPTSAITSSRSHPSLFVYQEVFLSTLRNIGMGSLSALYAVRERPTDGLKVFVKRACSGV